MTQSRRVPLDGRVLLRGVLPFAAVFGLATVGQSQTATTYDGVRELRIDGVTNDLSPVGWLAVASDGSVAIGQPQDFTVRFFSASGQTWGTTGRKGSGPGEFEAMTLHGWTGDTLWVADLSTRRITFMNTRGQIVRMMPWPTGVTFRTTADQPGASFIFVVPRAVRPDGTLLTFAYLTNDRPPDWMRRPPGASQPLLRLSFEGVFERIVGWVHQPNDQCYFNAPGGGRSVIPLCFQPLWSFGADGNLVSLANVEGTQTLWDLVRVTTLNALGDTTYSVVLNIARVDIPGRVADSVLAVRRQASMRQGNPPPTGLRLPTYYSAAQSLIVGRDGSVWLESGVIGRDRRWIILNANGSLRGELLIPRRLQLHVASLTTVWGTERDDDGVESIVRLRLTARR